MNEQFSYENIGQKIKELRQKAGISQTDLAQKIDVKPAFISLVEKGDKISLSRLQQILDVLGYEFSFTEKKTPLSTV